MQGPHFALCGYDVVRLFLLHQTEWLLFEYAMAPPSASGVAGNEFCVYLISQTFCCVIRNSMKPQYEVDDDGVDRDWP